MPVVDKGVNAIAGNFAQRYYGCSRSTVELRIRLRLKRLHPSWEHSCTIRVTLPLQQMSNDCCSRQYNGVLFCLCAGRRVLDPSNLALPNFTLVHRKLEPPVHLGLTLPTESATAKD